MNKEIKEILDYFRTYATIKEVNMIKQLLDYITNLQEENYRLKDYLKIMEKYFELIIDLGYDYDGFNESESLKGLIDELVRYAKLGKTHDTTEMIYEDGKDKKYNILNEPIGDDKE